MATTRPGVPIESVRVSAYRVPTETPESDGTAVWTATTMVLVEITAGGRTGLGYTYAARGAADVVKDTLAPLVQGRDAFDNRGLWLAMLRDIRNLGPPGLASMAVAAVDTALWDLKATLLGLPLVTLLGAAHDAVPGYGSGGFTSYSLPELERHLHHWVEQGFTRVKMKVGREPERDRERVAAARRAIGPAAELYVDANGAYTRKQALALAEGFRRDSGVTWLEEPVSSEDLDGLRLIRDRGPAGLDVAAGEYGYSAAQFLALLRHGAVDVLQADATRCCGVTGFLDAAALCWSFGVPLSSHCAPALHLHACLAAPRTRHMECFFDHVRIERLFFDGAPEPVDGLLKADLARPGLGLVPRRSDMAAFAL